MRSALPILLLQVPMLGELTAQEHPFLGAFSVEEVDGGVRVAWTIMAGGTCDGQDVMRSTDSVHFTSVHRIDGLCGDPEEPVSFAWSDAAPPELLRVYYRIKLGYADYSSVKWLDVDQLIEREQVVFPSPASDRVTLVFHAPLNTEIFLRVHAVDGSCVRAHDTRGAPRLEVDIAGLAPGLYVYAALAGGKRFTGRFVKE